MSLAVTTIIAIAGYMCISKFHTVGERGIPPSILCVRILEMSILHKTQATITQRYRGAIGLAFYQRNLTLECVSIFFGNGGAPTWGIKWPIFDHERYLWLPRLCWKCAGHKKISASEEQWLKNHHTWFDACSHYSREVMHNWKQTFCHHVNLPLSSNLAHCYFCNNLDDGMYK